MHTTLQCWFYFTQFHLTLPHSSPPISFIPFSPHLLTTNLQPAWTQGSVIIQPFIIEQSLRWVGLEKLKKLRCGHASFFSSVFGPNLYFCVFFYDTVFFISYFIGVSRITMSSRKEINGQFFLLVRENLQLFFYHKFAN